ncbi:MAG: histidine kinase [Flavobacteriales bacterium]|jgi:sensor histidine kinase YesM|nr:histidine kinase [Flavobacteriales bacterium]MBT4704747.1 histidine kinase [Flavobacteriales bacterium]MBT4931670.1 histidine kinase [Flavobacteriales bacterium]MBT5133636.1 histidine kinase [Flavobacteriales bacterium]MBT5977787.1 histidine kinase [Flavobacteriales bacterium]
METSRYYYKAQLIGWSLYILISTSVFILSGTELTVDLIGGIYLVFALGLITSHLYRTAIIRMGWLQKDIVSLVPRVTVSSILLAIAFHLVYLLIGNLAFGWGFKFSWTDPNLVTWAMLFFMWSLIYFSYNFFQQFRKAEIKNLRLEAARNEYELRRLKDQINPHFIFNALNTVRALIEENPEKAKQAVTQLSNVLRSSLQTGKDELIELNKEIQIVRDYLEIEKARYEERLNVEWQVDESHNKVKIPPLMLQTIVENCIKHGIAKLPDGGLIRIETVMKLQGLDIHVFNTGRYDENNSSATSLGLKNSKHRLDLSFGKDAWLSISNHNENMVRTTVHLPIISE